MRQLPAGLAEHVQGEATTLCKCWRLQRADGTVLGFTDHDRDIVFAGQTYEAATGFVASEIEQSLGMNVETQELAGALRSDRIAADDLRADRYDGARVEVWTVNWLDPPDRLIEQVFTIGEVREQDGAFRVELRSLAADMDETRGRRFIRACDADLGDARCKVALDDPNYRADVTVAELLNAEAFFADEINGFAANWFRGGKIRFDTGANAGLSVEIGEHYLQNGRAVLRLWKPLPFDLAPGDAAIVTAGCDKSYATCRAKFSNGANFRGFPHIPGNDFSLGYAAPFRVMDGGPIVP
jgi:uncharacterized phage protein (TIGR02218 family)